MMQEGRKLLLFTHRKSHTGFSFVPNSVTLNDLEQRIWPFISSNFAEFGSLVEARPVVNV